MVLSVWCVCVCVGRDREDEVPKGRNSFKDPVYTQTFKSGSCVTDAPKFTF